MKMTIRSECVSVYVCGGGGSQNANNNYIGFASDISSIRRCNRGIFSSEEGRIKIE